MLPHLKEMIFLTKRKYDTYNTIKLKTKHLKLKTNEKPMAILKLSAFLEEITGKINGTIFYKTKYGQVIKNNAYSLPQRSVAQLRQQAKIQTVASNWLNLSDADKIDWNNQTANYPYYNKVGMISYYSGYALFLMLNNNLLNAALPINLLVPDYVAITVGTLSIGSLETDTLILDYVGGSIGQTLYIYASSGLSPGASLKITDLKLFDIVTVSGYTTSFSYPGVEIGYQGSPVLGMEYYFNCKAIVTATGNKSNFSQITSQIVTT
jgi:hypothetical protein